MTVAGDITLVDEEGRAIIPTEELGMGAQGRVYLTTEKEAVKLLIAPNEPALVDRLAIPGSAFRQEDGPVASHRWVIWPRKLVFDEATRRLVGYTMPYVPIERRQTATAPARAGSWTTLREVMHWEDRRYAGVDVSFRWTLRAVIHVATAAAWAEYRGVQALDLNPRNVALHLRTALASLLDPDGIATSDEMRPVADDLRPPELIAGRHSSAADVARWALGVTVLQTLLQGSHPFDGVRFDHPPGVECTPAKNVAAGWCALFNPTGGQMRWPVAPQEVLSDEVWQLGRACLVAGLEDSAARPTAAAWAVALSRMDDALLPCAHSRRHFHLSGVGCPWCETAATAGIDLYGAPAP